MESSPLHRFESAPLPYLLSLPIASFMHRLDLKELVGAQPGDRVYLDQGENHVGTARLAYQEDRIYRWLLDKQRTAPAGDLSD